MFFIFLSLSWSLKSKRYKKDLKPEASIDDNAELSMVSITKLLEWNRQAVSSDFNAVTLSLEAKIDLIQSTILDHNHRITLLGINANVTERCLFALEKTCLVLSENNAKVKSKVTDLDLHSRWNNIRIVDLPKATEGPRPFSFFQLLSDVFGEEISQTPPEIERAHRTLIAKPVTEEKSRAVNIRLHRYQQELILLEARAKGANLKYQGNLIAIFED